MIERLGSTYQSLQGLEASRHFKAASQPLKPQDADETLLKPDASGTPSAPERMSASKSKAIAQLAPLIEDVQKIAKAVGYVGVSNEDVVRAYQQGSSFLADYKV